MTQIRNTAAVAAQPPEACGAAAAGGVGLLATKAGPTFLIRDLNVLP